MQHFQIEANFFGWQHFQEKLIFLGQHFQEKLIFWATFSDKLILMGQHFQEKLIFGKDKLILLWEATFSEEKLIF